MKAALYVRVSTVDQHCDIQLDDPNTGVRQFAKRIGATDTTEYMEKLSGKEGLKRPELERLLEDARLRKFDTVIVWKLDRFGRSVLDTLQNVQTLDRFHIRFVCSAMNIDTDDKSPLGKFVLQILACIAELERAFILERTITGHKAYRELYRQGKIGKTRHSRSGKDLPVGKPKRIFPRGRARNLREQGMSWRAIAEDLSVPVSTVRDALR